MKRIMLALLAACLPVVTPYLRAVALALVMLAILLFKLTDPAATDFPAAPGD